MTWKRLNHKIKATDWIIHSGVLRPHSCVSAKLPG